MKIQYVRQKIFNNHTAPRAVSSVLVLDYTQTLNNPNTGNFNMYYITKAAFTVEQKQSQHCNPCHSSAEAFIVEEYRTEKSNNK